MRLLRELALWIGAILGLLAVLAGVAVMFLGVHFLVFRSGSMSPGIPTGSLAMARTVPASAIRPGDVVTVRTASGAQVTHRVVSATHFGDHVSLVLKGDANSTPDTEVYDVTSAPRVIGSLPRAGYVAAYLLSPIGLVVAACLSGMLLVAAFTEKDEPEEDDERAPRGRGVAIRRAVAGAAVAAVIVSSGAAADGVTGTLATYTDQATMRTGTFLADTIDPAASMSCSPAATYVFGSTATITFAVPVNNALYSYVLRFYNSGGVQVGPDFAMSVASGTASRSFTTAAMAGALGSAYGNYVARVYSKLTATPAWESATYRGYSFSWGNVLATNYLLCGQAGP